MAVSWTIGPMTERDVCVLAAEESLEISEAQLREELGRPWAKLWVAKIGDEPVGFLLAWQVADELTILNIVVLSAFRRRGIGRDLLESAIRHAREMGQEKVLLEVRRSNLGAIELYRAAGFSLLDTRKGYYPDGEDALEMIRDSK